MLQKLDLKGGGLIKTIVRSHRTMPTVFFLARRRISSKSNCDRFIAHEVLGKTKMALGDFLWCVPQIYLHTKEPVLLKMERPHLIFETEVSRIVLIDNCSHENFLNQSEISRCCRKGG